MPEVSLKMNTKLTQRVRILSLISGADPEHITPRHLYLWSSFARLFYKRFPLTPTKISVLKKQIATQCRRETRESAFGSTASKQFRTSFSMIQNQNKTIGQMPSRRLLSNYKIG